ncbi:MAG TPA: methionine aminotransferase [Ohtaekwangia sp.]|nr:methionine aminotransferase [Ohtaekwangia sp.]
MKIDSKLPDTGTSIFTVMSKMALEYNAINLSQGFPDFEIDPVIVDLVYRFMREGHNQYAPMPGTPQLQQAISAAVLQTYQHPADAEKEITVTAGATEGIFAAIAAFVRAGDEVIIFDPAYDAYKPSVQLIGGTPVHVNLVYPDFSIDWDLVRRKISKKTRMIILNTPHNPCGAIRTGADLQELEKIAVENNLLVLSDEVYDRLVFDQRRHESVLRYPALAQRSLAIFSFGKTFHATGWKAGYVIAPEHLTVEFRKSHQFVVFSVNTPVQLALAEYLQDTEHTRLLGDFYQQKRDFFLAQIAGSSFEPLPCHGSYFQVLSYRNISDKPDTTMAEYLAKTLKVASIPVSVFYQDGTDNRLLRFCFAKKEETLQRACEILRKM